MSNPTEGQPQVQVYIRWDRVNGTFSSHFAGDPAEVIVFIDDEDGQVWTSDEEA